MPLSGECHRLGVVYHVAQVGEALGNVAARADDARFVRADVADAENAAVAGRHVEFKRVVGDGHQLLLPEIVGCQTAAARRGDAHGLEAHRLGLARPGRVVEEQYVPLERRPGNGHVADCCVVWPVNLADRLLRSDAKKHVAVGGETLQGICQRRQTGHISGRREGPFRNQSPSLPERHRCGQSRQRRSGALAEGSFLSAG